MKNPEPIFVVELLLELNQELIRLLRGLTPEDWQKPTLAKLWTVKDIASHLLDGNIRRISVQKDAYVGEPPAIIHSYQDLVAYLNQLNADWVKATRRISPRILINLLEQTGQEVYEVLKELDPYGKALYPVAWAGEEESQNWFDIAREYTERWHHQQQIRLTVNKPGMMNRKFYYPLLDTFMRALPHTYRSTADKDGTLVKVTVTGEGGGIWYVHKLARQWRLVIDANAEPDAEVIIPAGIAWRMFTKGIDRVSARENIKLNGQLSLCEPVLQMLAVMA